jgi:hypothetical protein
LPVVRLSSIAPHPGAAAGLLLFLAAAGCSHSEPFETDRPDPLGPSSSDLPRQVTFNPGDDRAPSVTGTAVVFSRRVPGAAFDAPCLAILPTGGGTLQAEYCPPAPTPVDTFVNNWLEPALSPDGTRIAFVWRRSAKVSALAAWSHDLIVAPVESPAAPLAMLSLPRTFPDGRIANTAMELRWVDDSTLRYLAAYEFIFKVKGGGASRFTDTTLLPYALMELDTRDGQTRMVIGADSVIAYADDGTGGAWIAWGDSLQSMLMHLAADGTRTPAPTLPFRASDLEFVDGELVAAGGGNLIAIGDPTTGAWRLVGAMGPVFRIAPGPDRTLVTEVERREVLFGAPANLWLLPFPQ